ncbi:MAG: hypothetical protein ABIH71_02215 [Candidatus Omnitrophota bacterium]|nr:hypothetical protein [Candidatus Omnitrophota bacterium]
MDKSKFIPIVFLIIILGVGFVAYKFYTDNQILTSENITLKKEKEELSKNNNTLKGKYDRAVKEKTDLEERWSKVENELTGLENDKDRWQKKYESIFKEREDLLAKLESLRTTAPRHQALETSMQREEVREERSEAISANKGSSQDYWIDFVKTKAEIEAELDSLRQDYLDASNDILRLETENKELSLKADELTREKENLERSISFKARTIDIMSRDVVNEREDRRKIIVEADQLRNENAELKREVILSNKERLQVQNVMKETRERRQVLERKVSDVENLLREKSLVFEELKDQLNQAVKSDAYSERSGMKESTAVELPPIVVKPESTKLQGFRGEVIAVNKDEKFVVLDLGEASGIKPGVQLKVMRGDKEVGTVEVIETRKEISAADIKETRTAIREGDIVVGG